MWDCWRSKDKMCVVSFQSNTQIVFRNIHSTMGGQGTCSYLLGNKGCHCYNGNATDGPVREAWLTAGTLAIIKKHVDESVGYIRIRTKSDQDADTERTKISSGTGFRVGTCYLMTAYHVLKDEINQLVEKIAFELDISRDDINFEDLQRKLEIKVDVNKAESFAMAVKRALSKFLVVTATDTSALLRRLEGFVNTEQIILKLEHLWKQNYTVDFINHGQFSVDWKITFGDKKSDTVILKLLAEPGQIFPGPMLLDENFMEHGNIHVIRYIHYVTPKIIMDQDTQEFKDDDELRKHVETAVRWWNEKFPNEKKNYFHNHYGSCKKSYDEETGHVVLKASKSFTHGASGSPIVYSFETSGQPIVGMIFQRGHPEFYYNAQSFLNQEYRRFKNINVDGKICFFEEGTTMKKVAQLLDKHNKHDIKQDLFALSAEREKHVINLDELSSLLHTKIAQEFTTLREDQARARADFIKDVTAKTEELARDVSSIKDQQRTIGEEFRSLQESVVDVLAQHASGLGSSETLKGQEMPPSTFNDGKMPSDDMVLFVEKWKEEDILCYVTKGIEDVLKKISSNEHGYISVIGVPGSGKSTTIRHVALYLQNRCHYTIYPVTNPKEFFHYLQKDRSQVFVIDDIVGEYFVDSEKLAAWSQYNDRIRSCLEVNKTTKFLISLRLQLYLDEALRGRTYIFNDETHTTNLSCAELKLSLNEMKNMLRHYLNVRQVDDIDNIIQDIWPPRRWQLQPESTTGREFADCFPLLCKVFSENKTVRRQPWEFFTNPIPALTDIFRQIKLMNKPQFCGLLLCGVMDVKDEYFSPFCELDYTQQKVFNSLIKSQKLDPEKDLEGIKCALRNLDGVYILHVGNRYIFCHSIFQNIVTYLYEDQYFVFKYATLDFINTRTRLFSKLNTDDDYVLVFHGQQCIELLVNRMIQELKCDARDGARFVTDNLYVNDVRLVSCLKTKLFDNNDADITQEMVDQLFSESLGSVWHYCKEHLKNRDETSWPCYKLLVTLIPRVDCGKQLWWGRYPLHLSVDTGSVSLTKLFVEQNINVNELDLDYNRSVLHMALRCEDNLEMTSYLLSLPNLTCLNQRDRYNRTPYWYVLNDYDGSNKDRMIEAYREKRASIGDDSATI